MFNLNYLVKPRFIFTLIFMSVLFFSLSCFGQVVETPTDPAGFVEEIIKLVVAIKAGTLGSWAIASSVLTLILQAFKLQILQKFLEKNRKATFAITTTLGVALSFVTSMVIGMGAIDALIASLITSGGAIAIYSAWRAIFKK